MHRTAWHVLPRCIGYHGDCSQARATSSATTSSHVTSSRCAATSCRISNRTERTAAASAPELGSPLPDATSAPGLRAAAQVFGIIAVVAVWVILNKSAGGTYECLDVGVGCGRAAALSASACVRGPLQ
jgi:hypothetical protein